MEFRLLRADEIEARVARITQGQNPAVMILLYKDARCDMNILDETVGAENWQRHHEVVNGNLFCNVGIWVDRRHDGYGEWVWKQDVGTESNTEATKGEASDSFKRACFNLGIGRELYTAPTIMFYSNEVNIKNGKTYDRFKVTGIEYDKRRIKSVTVKNLNTGKEKIFKQDTAEIPNEDPLEKTAGGIFITNFTRIREWLAKEGIAEADVAKDIGIKDLTEMTSEQWKSWTAKYKEGSNE